jgi:curved DNA-binding protein CbpA
MTDYYNVLGVSEDADIKDIKKSYRELSLKWHPDKNKDPEAITKIQQINEAYATLGEQEKRKKYDEERRNPQCFQQQECYHHPHHPHHPGFPSGFSFSTNAPAHFFTSNDAFAKEIQQNLRDQFSQSFFKGIAGSFGINTNQNGFSEYKVHKQNGVFVTSFRMSSGSKF